MTISALHSIFLEHPTICTDTRKISKNCLFFALKGPNFNGNTFANTALEKGAAFVVVDEPEYAVSDKHILVDDVLQSLQKLANYHRRQSKARIIALTGSNGKTTTKELIAAVLATTYNTIATEGNLNNHIGVPLTLLSIKKDAEMAVVEMGANHQGEIDFLCKLAEPDFGYITNFGKAHLEGFGGIEGVIKGKSELYRHLQAHQKLIFLNADDPIQLEKLESYIQKSGFSTENHTYYPIHFKGANPFVELQVENTGITTQLIGAYNFSNCSAAILIGKYFNVPLEQIKLALETYVPENNRSQIIQKNEYYILLDAYNANPTSMAAALHNFHSLTGPTKTLILGDMFELGVSGPEEHQQIADLVASLGFEHVYLVGEHFAETKTDFLTFPSFNSFKEAILRKGLLKGKLLIKGSRGMALERVLELL